ncbi:uncharacterized protein LOC144923802 [Branchiostoma floridae x Branchiostoma belcheri]
MPTLLYKTTSSTSECRFDAGELCTEQEIFVLPFYLGTRAMEEYREDFAFEESIENEAVCQIRKQSYEKRTVKVIKHLSLLQQDFCTRLALRAVRTEDSRHHCN